MAAPMLSQKSCLAMESFTIPISVKARTQRTLKLVGCGLKSILTTKVSGTLIVRKKVNRWDHDPIGILPWHETPDPTAPAQPPKGGEETEWPSYPATVYTEEVHEDLVSHGIKVRDFAYPTNRVGHAKPVHPHPMAFGRCNLLCNVEFAHCKEAEAESDNNNGIPVSPEATPMPTISMTWTEPHPSLRPLPKRQRGDPVEVPTPDKPYRPTYETHRIPGWFEQSSAIMEHDGRLAESPRTVPIRGITTRRLLTLSPDLVDLARYDEMDLEELRRYDRRLVWQLMNGIEPYPWRAIHGSNWVPSRDTRKQMSEVASNYLEKWDKFGQRDFLSSFVREGAADDTWEAERLDELRRENVALGRNLVRQKNGDSPFDVLDKDNLTLRQRIEVWERRMHSDQAHKKYAEKVQTLKMMRTFDAERRGEAIVEEDVEMDPPPMPFVPGQWNTDIPLFPLWGPLAPYDGAAYRLLSAPPTKKTIGEYVAELSRCTAVPAPAPAAPVDFFALYLPFCCGEIFYYHNKGKKCTHASALDEPVEDLAGEEQVGEEDPKDEAPSSGRKRGIDEVEPAQEEDAPGPKRAKASPNRPGTRPKRART
ncbi:hypothetical protein FB451DRAFT_147158 [Mycena latifolia]|nr:hypothetical protein FB451DRAFT_147158 [Mycena latifolia]